MKRLALILAFLLLACNVFAGQTVRPVITSGTVAAGGVLISAVNGTAFIDVDTSKTGGADFSAALLAAVTHNDVIEITSVTNKQKLIGFAKAAGSGTLGTDNLVEKITNGDFGTGDLTGWTESGTTADKDFTGNKLKVTMTASGDKAFTQTSISLVSRSLYKRSFIVSDYAAGDRRIYFRLGTQETVDTASMYRTSDGTSSGYITLTTGNNVRVGNDLGTGLTNGDVFAVDDCTFKQVTAPSAAGITITNSPGGATYNFGLLPTLTTFYNDSAGYTYRILSRHAYGALIATQAPVSGTLHIATVDGGAMFFHDSIDFSSYAGNDTDSTKYLFVFYDSTGKSAQAYAGAVGGGEALGDELVTNGDMETGDPPTGWNVRNLSTLSSVADERTGGSGSASINIYAGSDMYGGAIQTPAVTSGILYYLSAWGKNVDGGNGYLVIGQTSGGNINILINSVSWTQKTKYYTAINFEYIGCVVGTLGKNTRLDDISFKALTDVPATGLHLLSTKNGSTRNMKSVESGFDANAITRVNIYRAL